MLGSLGSKRTTGRSPPPMPAPGLGSSVATFQLSPPSSERYNLDPPTTATAAKSVFGALRAIARLACTIPSGRPLLSWFQVVPPSTDLKMPPPFPGQLLFSQGPSRDSQSDA